MQWKRGWGGGAAGREVERLLSSTSESTVNNTGNYRGRQKKKGRETGFWRARGAGMEGVRQGGRKKGPRRVNITVLCQANIRCWDTSTKSHRSFGREEDGAGERVGEDASVWQQAETPSQKLGSGKWKHGASDKQLLLLNRTKRFFS